MAIRVAGLSKSYNIQQRADGARGYRTIREELASLASFPSRLIRRMSVDRNGENQIRTSAYWALKDVSFEVPQGEVVGIIGPNGAGKSTLLKILSRIVRPTSGRIELRGRVASLLEVGTGFHPELTGRENIFLNGSVLGMGRSEIVQKFDEIVAFSGVERFLDTPVKRYSSGMQVRLAFAVAAHLDPEVLIIDEVLAVGDAEFQQRCLRRMREVARSGRTILFVSHNMAAIDGLCQSGVVLKAGQVDFIGTQSAATAHYLSGLGGRGAHACYEATLERVPSRKPCEIRSATVVSAGEYSPSGYAIGAPLEFRVKCHAHRPVASPTLGIGIDNAVSDRLATFHFSHSSKAVSNRKVSGDFEFTCRLECLPLTPGDYHVKLSLEEEGRAIDVIEHCLRLTILSTDYYQNGGKFGRGGLLCRNEWELLN